MNKGSIVERLCSDLDRKEPRYKSPTLLYFTFIVCTQAVMCCVLLTERQDDTRHDITAERSKSMFD